MCKLLSWTLSACVLVAIMGFAAGGNYAKADEEPDFSLPGKGDFLVRLRGTYIIPEGGFDKINVAGIATFGNDAEISEQAIPEIDLSYFITDNFALEVPCCITHHKLSASGTLAAAMPGLGLAGTEAATSYILPATVLLQYHFRPTPRIKPYAGVGPALVMFVGEEVGSALKPIATKVKGKTAFGFTTQLGVDVALGGNWSFNIDAKYMRVDFDATWTTPGVGTGKIKAKDIQLNPWLLSIGFGYHF